MARGGQEAKVCIPPTYLQVSRVLVQGRIIVPSWTLQNLSGFQQRESGSLRPIVPPKETFASGR